MAPDALLITVNRRLARTLKKTHKERILAWDDFLLELFELNRAATQSSLWRLSSLQEKMLWSKAMDEFPAFGFAREQTIECARDGYVLVKAYQLKPDAFIGYKEDSDLFSKACERFELLCRDLNAFSSAAIIEQLLLMPSLLIYCKHIKCYGFDEWTPSQQALISHWDNLGVTVERMPQLTRNGDVCKIIAEDKHDEMYRAVLHAKSVQECGETMAIVVPKLQDQWAFVEHQLVDVFNKDVTYNISSGASLDKQPIIYALLETFKTLDKDIPIQSWGNILHSPFIKGGCSEAAERALFEMQLCDYQRMALTLETVQSHRHIPAIFAAQCSSVNEFKQSLSQRSMRGWIVWLKEWIDTWAWGQERTLSSAEYQCVDTLHDVIPALYSLDALQNSFSFNDFLSALYDLLKSTLFQIETQDKPIQVLGLLEAAGLSFDHVWVVGLTADNNPAKAMPHPLIPTHIQIQHDMPHSTPERELRVAKRLLERLILGADHVILSYPGQDEKGEPQLESPLISRFAIKTMADVLPERKILSIARARDFQAYDDPFGLPLSEKHLKGGSSVLKNQAACPHAGYVKHRLMAKSPKEAVIGISTLQQGTIAHDVLERLWSVLKNRTGLIRLDENELAAEIKKHIMIVLNEWEPAFTSADKLIQSKYLQDLMTRWLDFEKTRDDFEVAKIEENIEVTLNELTLTLKMDRVDRIGGDQYFLIDYKTGEASKKSWELPRMDEPQLPLYAANIIPEPLGMAFGLLKKGKTRFEEVGGDDAWSETLNLYREDLNVLANEVITGCGTTTPKYGDFTCNECDLKSGCRVHTGGIHEG